MAARDAQQHGQNFGNKCLPSITSAINNIALGVNALKYNTTGNYNIGAKLTMPDAIVAAYLDSVPH